MKDKKAAKLEALKGLIDLMRSKEKESWKSTMKKPEKEEEESEEEEECDCGKESCPECGKKKGGVGIIIAVEGKKKPMKGE
jgi:hypothetical protein